MAVLLKTNAAKCDARCYGADHPRCACGVCGGLMHGIGKDAAMSMVAKLLKHLTAEEVEEVGRPKKKSDPNIVTLTGRVDRQIVTRLRAPTRIRRQIEAGQMELPLVAYSTYIEQAAPPKFRRLSR